MTSIAVLVATYGDPAWADLAERHAVGSVEGQHPDQLVVLHGNTMTLSEARNAAAECAMTDWLCFLDADDTLAPDYLAQMRDIIDRGEGQRLLTPAVERDGFVSLIEPRRSIWHGNWLVIGTLIPRALFVECGGFWDERGWEDWSLWIRAVELGALVVAVPGAVYQCSGSSGRNTVERPYALGMEIRARNKEWLASRFANHEVLADATERDQAGLAMEAAR